MTMSDARCEAAIQRGVEFLQRRQLPSGEFETLAGPDPDFVSNSQPDPILFTTVHVAISLLEVRHDAAAEMVPRAAEFLRSEMLPGGLWRFWTASHPGSPGIPPDTDDTACIAHLLQQLGIPFPDNRASLLGNRSPQETFYTWILPRPRHLLHPGAWHLFRRSAKAREAVAIFFRSGQEPPDPLGVEAVVNANALLYLGDGPHTSCVSRWLADVVRQGRATSSDRYYQSEYALFHALARCIEHGVASLQDLSAVMVRRIEASEPAALPALECALAACALSILAPASPSLPALIECLLAAQQPDGGWPARVFYYGGYKRCRAWGSAELTTGFCLEALARYQRTRSGCAS